VATRAIPAVTTRPVSLEKSERVASELILVQRVQRGDEEAFATLFSSIENGFTQFACR